MAIKTFIFKNTTDSNLNVNDLSGVRLPASGIVNVTEMFTNYTIYESLDLKTVISGGQMIINDGVEDLSVYDALIYCSYETPIDQIPGLEFNDNEGTYSIIIDDVEYNSVTVFRALTDTPSTYSGSRDQILYVNSSVSGVNFRPKYHEDYYVEYTYSGIRVVQEDIWENNTKTKKIMSKVMQRSGGRVSQVTKYIYDYDTGTEIISTAVSTPTMVNGKVTKIDKIKN